MYKEFYIYKRKCVKGMCCVPGYNEVEEQMN